jgi:transcriptional regulator with XRE-family HTH domain
VNNISENIARIMKVRGITQKELAGHLNVSQQTVCKWLHGGRPKTARFSKIAEALGVPVGELATLNGGVAGTEGHGLSQFTMRMAGEFDSLSAAGKLAIMEKIFEIKNDK